MTGVRMAVELAGANAYFIYFISFYFICHTIITKNIGKEEKKKWRGDLTETIGAYERLGLLELWARAVSHQLKKRGRKVEDGKIYELFSYLLNNLIFSFFLKEERDWELMTLLSSELKNLGPWNKGESLVWVYFLGTLYILSYFSGIFTLLSLNSCWVAAN